MQEEWRTVMKRLFGIGYTERDRFEPLKGCIQTKGDFYFIEHSLKALLTRLNDSSENVSHFTIFVLHCSSGLRFAIFSTPCTVVIVFRRRETEIRCHTSLLSIRRISRERFLLTLALLKLHRASPALTVNALWRFPPLLNTAAVVVIFRSWTAPGRDTLSPTAATSRVVTSGCTV